ncbi:MAG TPA: DUF2167 domain-containing protein [Planctomycetota bacterium]|nr:DUF2167 domain-containing protein [Planctomycetota bacterium]
MTRSIVFVWLLGLTLTVPALCQSEEAAQPDAPEEAPPPSHVLAKYHPAEGTARLGTVAEVKLTDGWTFLRGPDGRRFLKDLGNDPGPAILGVAIPPDFEDSHAFAVYTYIDDGHVADDDAPDYDQLLADMKADAVQQSKARKKAGQGGVKLLGWAEDPHYDKAEHKLFWAEKLEFEGNDGLTLNYNVRVLGRTGHLVVNGVGDIEQLSLVAEHNQYLMQATEFVDGQRYSDYDASTDKLAAYGIGGLIAGTLAAKAGLFAKLALLLKAAIKPIIAGLVVVGAFLGRLFGRRKQEPEAPPAT